MAYVYNRGTKEAPNWHARFKEASGKWRMIKVPSKHATKKAAQRWIDDKQSEVEAGRPDPSQAPSCAELMKLWVPTLKNRNVRDDERTLKLHVLPFFGPIKVSELEQRQILDWIDMQRATPKKRGKGNLSDASVRKHFILLQRFLSWCVPRYLKYNPASSISSDKRPQQRMKIADAPWIEDEKTVRDLFHALPSPFNLMFYIANRSGMRLGEVCGLRLRSFDTIEQGTVWVRYSYDDGFLKEDKKREGKSKNVPAPDDLAALVLPWLEHRKAAGATSESLVFPNDRNKGKAYQRLALERAWEKACTKNNLVKVHPDDVELDAEKQRKVPFCTWYEGTRHSFASRIMKATRGQALYEVSQALGHASVTITLKHYSRWVVTSYSGSLRGGLGLGAGQEATVIPMKAA